MSAVKTKSTPKRQFHAPETPTASTSANSSQLRRRMNNFAFRTQNTRNSLPIY
jgi:hypothetical protein